MPPMPEKLNISQVVPGVAWSSGHSRPYVRIPAGYQLEGEMNHGEKGRPTGWSRSLPTDGTVSTAAHLVWFLLAQLPAQRKDHS